MNQNITIGIGRRKTLTLKAQDAQGNDITALCTFAVASSDTTVASVGGTQASGFYVDGLKIGTATITTTASDASGTISETDTITVAAPAPAGITVTYND